MTNKQMDLFLIELMTKEFIKHKIENLKDLLETC